MAEVDTMQGLLVMALQDLHDGECAMAERLGEVRENTADEGLSTIVERDTGRSEQQRDQMAAMLRELGEEPGEAENIWLRAILDDADGDAETIARGPLRDIALAGALRKGKQSQRVSYETAIALARKLAMEDAAATLSRMAEGAEETDTALAEGLTRLSAST